MVLTSMKKIIISAPFILAVAGFIPSIGYTHEGRIIGDYRLVVGHKNEPAFASVPNALELIITRITGVDKPINSQQGDTVDLEAFVQFCGRDNFRCDGQWIQLEPPQQGYGTENRYYSYYLPTESGVYAFRLSGIIAEPDEAAAAHSYGVVKHADESEGAAPLEIDEVFICGEGSMHPSSQFGCVEQALAVPEQTAAEQMNPIRRAFPSILK
jgi:hypothetical protein